MATLTIRLTENKVERLKALAAQRNISVNKLMDELATYAIAEFDAETRFRLRAARGSAVHGKQMLRELDRHYGTDSHTLHDSAQQKYDDGSS